MKTLYPAMAPTKVSVPPFLLAWLGSYGSSRLRIPAAPAHMLCLRVLLPYDAGPSSSCSKSESLSTAVWKSTIAPCDISDTVLGVSHDRFPNSLV